MGRFGSIASASSSRRSFLQLAGVAGGVAVVGAVCQSASVTSVAPAADELTSMSATELAKLIRLREVSSVEVIDAHLERIHEVNPKINAIAQLAESARNLAEQADSIATSDTKKPLHGVPVTIKDEFNTAGIRTAIGPLGLKDNIPDRDATIVRRFKSTGAIVLCPGSSRR